MSWLLIGGTIGALLVLLIAFNGYQQAREQQRVKKLEEIFKRRQQVDFLSQLLTAIPTRYLNKELCGLLNQQIDIQLQNIMALDPEQKRIREEIAETETRGQQIESGQFSIDSPVNSNDQAQALSNQLNRLLKLLSQWQKRKLISPTQFQLHKTRLELAVKQISIELLLLRASKDRMSGILTTAMKHIEQAIEELEKIPGVDESWRRTRFEQANNIKQQLKNEMISRDENRSKPAMVEKDIFEVSAEQDWRSQVE